MTDNLLQLILKALMDGNESRRALEKEVRSLRTEVAQLGGTLDIARVSLRDLSEGMQVPMTFLERQCRKAGINVIGGGKGCPKGIFNRDVRRLLDVLNNPQPPTQRPTTPRRAGSTVWSKGGAQVSPSTGPSAGSPASESLRCQNT